MCPLSDARRELVIGIVALLIVVAGVAVDMTAVPVQGGPSTTTSDRLVERAIYCPPGAPGSGEMRLAAVPEDSSVAAEGLVAPLESEPIEIPADSSVTRSYGDGVAQHVVGSDTALVGGAATTFSEGSVTGTAGARCARAAVPRWYFAAGSSTLAADNRLLIHNPFPEDAVVGVRFVTPQGERAPANAADLPIPSGETITVNVNDFVTAERLLSSIVVADRGRVVAWRVMLEQPEGLPEGVVSTLGARRPSPLWYFPVGYVQSGAREVISVLNPSEREALVALSLATGRGAVQPRGLAEVRIPPQTSVALSLPDNVGDKQAELGGASAILTSTNDVDVVVERTVYHSGESLQGIESEIGATQATSRWALAPLAPDASIDRLVVLNAGSDPADISVTLYRPDGEPVRPQALQGIQLRPGLRRELELDGVEGAARMIAVVTSSRPVVAERLAMSAGTSDVASVMGVPMSGGQAEAT